MRRLASFAAALPIVLVCAVLTAQQPKATITGPKQADAGDIVKLDASQSTGLAYKWVAIGHSKSFFEFDKGLTLVCATGRPGDYVFALVAAGTNNNGGAAADVALWTVTIGGGPMPPTPPTPVDPPTPPVPPAPIPVAGLWVLLIEETAARDKLTPGQREILLATGAGSVREYLASHCAKEGAQPAFRVLDKDDSLDRESKTWQEVWARPRAAVPWLVASNGKEGYEGPLPGTVAECLTLLKKYGGP